jgi:4-amino-4-deoxy-L-arabinose transferase-like glycosyltransferase
LGATRDMIGIRTRLRDVVAGWFDHRFALGLAAVAVLALGVRIVFTLTHGAISPADPRTYHLLGVNLADGLGYVRPPQIAGVGRAHLPTAEFPPLFPALIAAATLLGARSPTSQALAMCFVGTGTVVMIGLIGRRFAGSAVGLVAAGLAALHPLIFQPDGVLMSESLYLFLGAALLLAALAARDDPRRWWRWALLGGLIGLAALTRAEGLLFLPVLSLPLALGWGGPHRDDRIRAALVTVAATALVVVPWVVRNTVEFGRFVPVSTSSGTVVLGSNCDQSFLGSGAGSWHYSCIDTIAAIEGKDWTIRPHGKDEAQVYDHWRKLGFDYARAHPGELPRVMSARFLRAWGLWNPGQQIDFDIHEGRDRIMQTIGYYLDWVLLPLAVAAVVVAGGRRRGLWILLAPAAVVTITAVLGYGSTRIRAIAEPTLVVLAATAIVWGMARLRGRARISTGA